MARTMPRQLSDVTVVANLASGGDHEQTKREANAPVVVGKCEGVSVNVCVRVEWSSGTHHQEVAHMMTTRRMTFSVACVTKLTLESTMNEVWLYAQ